MKTLMVYSTNGKDWYIRIRNEKNGKVVADGGEAYATKSNAIRAARNNWADGYALQELGYSDKHTLYKMVPTGDDDHGELPRKKLAWRIVTGLHKSGWKDISVDRRIKPSDGPSARKQYAYEE